MFALYKENESDSYRMERERERKRGPTHQSVSIVIVYACILCTLRLSADVCTSERTRWTISVLSLSLSIRFISFLPRSFARAYNWWAKTQVLNIRRDESWKKASARTRRKREERARTPPPPPPLTSFCLYSSYSRQTIVVYNFFFLLHDQAGRRWTSITVSLGIHSSTSLICETFSYITDTHTHTLD